MPVVDVICVWFLIYEKAKTKKKKQKRQPNYIFLIMTFISRNFPTVKKSVFNVQEFYVRVYIQLDLKPNWSKKVKYYHTPQHNTQQSTENF